MRSRTQGAKYIAVKRFVEQKWIYDRVTIRTIGNRPMWYLFKEFINSLSQGYEFSRKDLFYAIFTEESADAIRCHETAVDKYRLYCTHVGYLEHIDRALYRKRFDIPVNATSKLIQSYAYNVRHWQEWFIPKCERRKAILEHI